MDFDKVKKALLKYNYVCIRLDSNFQVLEQLRTEGGICILGEDMSSKEFLTDLKGNLKKHSLLYFHDFQRGDIFDKQLLMEWNKLYHKGGTKLPYLLVSTFSLYYTPVKNRKKGDDLSFDKDRFLDFSKGEPKISYSSINFTDPSDVDQALYDRMCDVIVHDMSKNEGYRGLVIVPNLESQDYVFEKLHDLLPSEYVIKFLPDDIPDSALFSPEKAKKYTHNFVFISLDLTHSPIFLTELDVVYDSGEKDQNYETRAGFNRLKTVKINRQEMKARMMSYAPQFYMIMFPKTSILSLEKYFTPDVNDDIDILELISMGYDSLLTESLKIRSVGNLEKYGLIKKGKTGFEITEMGKFCRAITIPVRHSSLIYEGMIKFRDQIKTVIILVSIFVNIDLYDVSTPFDQIYRSVFRKVDTSSNLEKLDEVDDFEKLDEVDDFEKLDEVDDFEKLDEVDDFSKNKKDNIPKEIISSIEELSDVLEIDSKILDPVKQFNLILPHLKTHYRHNILRYQSGKWEDGSRNEYDIIHIKGCKMSPTILPLTIWRNVKGKRYVGHYLPLVSI